MAKNWLMGPRVPSVLSTCMNRMWAPGDRVEPKSVISANPLDMGTERLALRLLSHQYSTAVALRSAARSPMAKNWLIGPRMPSLLTTCMNRM